MSSHTDTLDEGAMKLAFYLSQELSKSHEVFQFNAKGLLSKSLWKKLKGFQPQIVHIFLRPDIITLAIAGLLRFYLRHTRIVISSLQPPLQYPVIKRLVPLVKPDLVLTQSDDTARMFSNLGCNTAFLTSAVDTQKFTPVSPSGKEGLRKKYAFDSQKYIVLHVGHIRKGRNLEVICRIQGGDNQVLIISSTAFQPDMRVYNSLKEQGCVIWRQHFENLEEIYGLADCYLFPTINRSNCIEFPLSVLEAMSCNLPVIVTKFGGLPKFLEKGDGMIFVAEEDDLLCHIEHLKQGDVVVRTREKVLPYTWENTAARLEKMYTSLLTDD
ncbi:glycosyltransferase family 4 protein [Chloroflexota bacterium]